MNPALPLLAVLTLAGPLLRPGRKGLAWAACGLAGMALLAPALALPDGIPGPAASLAADAPWQQAANPAAGNPILGDVTHQVYPWLLFLRDELRAGRWPFWNPFQSSGQPYWGNGSSAPLFPLHLLFVALPLQLGFILLPWIRVVVGGCGAFALGRELGLSRPAALVAAFVFPLSGMVVGFLLFPMGNALALVPWVLLAVERMAAGRWGFVPLAVAGGLQLLAGHPETALHTALLSGLYLLVRGGGGGRRTLSAWIRLAGGWAAAAALAAVEILPLALTLFDTSRWQSWQPPATSPPLGLLLAQALRLVLPDLYGNPALGTWWGPFNYLATAVYAGALTLPLAAAGAAAARRDRRWAAVLVLLAFSFAAAYHLPGVRDLLLELPLVGRVLHHRLIFGIELSLALLAGAGCDRWLAGRGRAVAAGAALTALLLAAAWALHGDEWASRGLARGQLLWTLWAGGAALLLVASLALPRERRWALWPALPALLLADLVAAHGRVNPAQPLAQLYPETGVVRFLAGRPERIAALGSTLRPNAAMVYRLFDVRGDDSVKLASYERLYAAHLGEGHPTFFRPMHRWTDPWLDRLGVRWVMAGPADEPPVPVWRLAYAGADARVYERSGALPPVRWLGGGPRGNGGTARIERREPGAWDIAWENPRRRLLVIAEAWDRGWRAYVDGERVPTGIAGGALIAVRLGPGSGRLTLRHVPAGLPAGSALSVAGLGVIGAAALLARRRRA